MNTPSAYFLPRDLHPAAWWVWAIGLAAAATRTTNPWLLLTIIAVVSYTVVARRSEAPWAMAFRMYLYLGLLIVVLRVGFRILFGGAEGSTVLLELPEIPLPEWAAGVQLLGAVSAESVLGGLYDGLRLATIIICLGAANALANPKRLLKSMPSALYEVGTAVVVALSVFPQLAESVVRVRRARKLRGGSARRLDVIRTIAVPVLEDALERSLQLAAAMDSRGYGRTADADPRQRRLSGTLMIAGLMGVCVGAYALQDWTLPRAVAFGGLLAGTLLGVLGMAVAGRGARRTRYRADRWRLAEIVVAGVGVAVAAGFWVTAGADPMGMSVPPIGWPSLDWVPLGVVVLGVLPAWLTPPPLPPYSDNSGSSDSSGRSGSSLSSGTSDSTDRPNTGSRKAHEPEGVSS